MKWKITLLIALVIGGLAGSWIKNLPGFVIIAIDKTTYEMRLWIAICLILLIMSSVIMLLMLVHSLIANARKVKGWHGERHWKKTQKRSIQGMLAFTEGRWKASEDAMVKAAQTSDTKLINYLIAAQAAQQQRAEVRRDTYLRLAHEAEPKAKTAIGLTQARLQILHRQYEQALASLNELRQENPNHPFVLKLLCNLFETLQDWTQLEALLPTIKKHHVLEAEELTRLEEKTIGGILKSKYNEGNIEALNDHWLKLPAALRKSKNNILSYVRLIIEFEQYEEAEALLRPLIKKQVDAEVLKFYGRVRSTTPEKQFDFLDSWYQSNPGAPREVFLTLGKIAWHAKYWGKARHFLELALQQKPTAEVYLYMARSLEELNDTEHASTVYQQGLEFIARPKRSRDELTLPEGSDDLVTSDLLPRFQKLGQ